MTLDLGAYLRRIGHDGPRDASVATLRGIARAHAMAIPFENVAVLSSGAPSLEVDAVADKLVARGRGGYCFEQNALLLAALTELGFEIVPLSARVRYGLPPRTMTPRSHMVLDVATLEGRMLVDAGFGGSTLTAPVRLDTTEPQETPHEDVRIVPEPGGFLLQALLGEAWTDLYAFDRVRQHPVDYAQQNWYTATRPGALFANNLVVARPAPDGRHTVFNRTYVQRPRSGDAVRTAIASAEALRALLAERFGLALDDDELARAWDVSGRGPAEHAMFV